VGVEDETIAIPLLFYDRGGFYLHGIEIGYAWRKGSPVSVTVFGQTFFDGYASDDSPFLAGMEDRDLSFHGGVGVEIDRKRVAVGLRVSTDLTNRSDGHRGRLDVRFPCAAGPWRLTPAIGAEYLSDDVVDYYYGVRPAEATGARPVHAGDAALNVLGSLRAIRSAGGRWSFFGYAEVTRFGAAIERSPLVEDGTGIGALAGVLYTF
jgi:outer membrane protein